jgi:predicted transglutaminase-like cysteine proteinase
MWSKLATINASVNDAIWPLDDERHFGRAEYWTIPTDGYGNCHDYALTKRKELADAGFSRRALRVAIVITPRNGRHAILTVATDKGDYVLDNLTNDILPWDKTGYVWIARQDEKNDWGWVTFEAAPSRLAAGAAYSNASPR